jgi:hypothetical protein
MNPAAFVWSTIGPNNNNNNDDGGRCLEKRLDEETLHRDHRIMIAQIQDLQQHVFRNDCAIASMQSSIAYLADRLRTLEASGDATHQLPQQLPQQQKTSSITQIAPNAPAPDAQHTIDAPVATMRRYRTVL